MITPEQLAIWAAACEKATRGPWVDDRCASVETSDGIMIADFMPNVDDVDFIIAARVALPALLAEVEQLQAEHAADAAFIKDAKAAVSELEDENADLRAQHDADAAYIRDLNIALSSEEDDNIGLRAALESANLELSRWRAAGAGA